MRAEATPKTRSYKMLQALLKDKTIRQPVSWTYAKYDYSALEQRIRYALMYLAQKDREGITDTLIGTIEKGSSLRRIVTIPIQILQANSSSNNYDDIRDAVESYAKKPMVITDDQGDKLSIFPFVAVYPKRVKGKIHLVIDHDIWETYAIESIHYTEFDLLQAMQFKSQTTMRLYEIANTITKQENFSIDTLRDIFCLAEKYPNTGNFVRFLERAAEELKNADVSLVIEKIKSMNDRSHKILYLSMSPVYNTDEKTREKQIKKTLKEHGLSWLLTANERYQLEECGFNDNEICANIVTIRIAQEILNRNSADNAGFAHFVKGLRSKADNKDNPQGFIIQILKNKIDETRKEEKN